MRHADGGRGANVRACKARVWPSQSSSDLTNVAVCLEASLPLAGILMQGLESTNSPRDLSSSKTCVPAPKLRTSTFARDLRDSKILTLREYGCRELPKLELRTFPSYPPKISLFHDVPITHQSMEPESFRQDVASIYTFFLWHFYFILLSHFRPMGLNVLLKG